MAKAELSATGFGDMQSRGRVHVGGVVGKGALR
jgi:hypothetical protein